MTSGQLDVYLAGPAELPAPWRATADPAVWVLPAGRAAQLEVPDTVAAPYPALVSVGHDVEAGVVLLNLDHLGSLGVTGPEQLGFEALTAIALELGTAPWAEDLTLTVIGSLAELGDALAPGRLRYVPVAGNVPATEPEKTHVVLATRPLDQVQHDRLRAQGAAVVTCGSAPGQWSIDLADHDHGVVQPLGLHIRPQLVDQRTYAGILEVLLTSKTDPNDPANQPRGKVQLVVPFDPAAAPTDTTQVESARTAPAPAHETAAATPAETRRYDIGRPESPTTTGDAAAGPEEAENGEQAGGEVVDERGDEHRGDVQPETLAVDAPAAADLDEQASPEPSKPEQASDQEVEPSSAHVDEPGIASAAGTHPLLETGHPVIRLLGPVVDIVGATAAAPASETHRKACTRLAAYLALNPDT
jgi:hypothetical protein